MLQIAKHNKAYFLFVIHKIISFLLLLFSLNRNGYSYVTDEL
jgi:hypothetical protein